MAMADTWLLLRSGKLLLPWLLNQFLWITFNQIIVLTKISNHEIFQPYWVMFLAICIRNNYYFIILLLPVYL